MRTGVHVLPAITLLALLIGGACKSEDATNTDAAAPPADGPVGSEASAGHGGSGGTADAGGAGGAPDAGNAPPDALASGDAEPSAGGAGDMGLDGWASNDGPADGAGTGHAGADASMMDASPDAVMDASAGDASVSDASVMDGSATDTATMGGSLCLPAAAPTGYAFGAHPMKYPPGTARPSGEPCRVDDQVTAFFDAWKKAYLRSDCPGGYYLFSAGGAGVNADTFLTTSEAHGYAMIIFALMNGYDPQAHDIFDGLLGMMKKYPSVNTPALMAWGIDRGCKPVVGNDSASDGDLDMAYALLLADKVWGSGGRYNYRELAGSMLAALKVADMNSETHLPKLGDWVTRDEAQYYVTRPSDFMVDHFRAFSKARADSFWDGTVTSIYGLVDYIQSHYAPETGLVPDFIMETNTAAPQPVPLAITNDVGANGLGEDLHSDYDYNSCRVPWRLATDYVVTGDAKVKARLSKINAFIQKVTGGDPANVIDGYSFAGEPWKGKPAMGTMPAEMAGQNGCFTASFGTGAIVDSANQAWVDAVWKYIQSTGLEGDEYTASVKLLNMIVMSGNWWAP